MLEQVGGLLKDVFVFSLGGIISSMADHTSRCVSLNCLYIVVGAHQIAVYHVVTIASRLVFVSIAGCFVIVPV